MPPSGVVPPRTVFVTPIVFIVTALVSVTAILHPQWTLLLRRDEPAWAAGQLWRILTPVLVQPDGWGQLAFNLAGIAILGTAAELRGLSWLASYAFPAVASICVMYVAAPADRGGGSSDGVAGLIAALAVVNVARPGGSTRLTEQLARGYSVLHLLRRGAQPRHGVGRGDSRQCRHDLHLHLIPRLGDIVHQPPPTRPRVRQCSDTARARQQPRGGTPGWPDRGGVSVSAERLAMNDTVLSGGWTFRRVTRADYPLLAAWLAQPEVYRWWQHESTPDAVEHLFGPTIDGEEPNEDWLGLLDGQPQGLVQRSRVAAYAENLRDFARLGEVPDGAVTFDYLIGENRGRGYGTGMLSAFAARTWTDHPGTPAILVTVVAANARSWRALQRVGFAIVGVGDAEPENACDDPMHYLLRLDRPPGHEGSASSDLVAKHGSP